MQGQRKGRLPLAVLTARRVRAFCRAPRAVRVARVRPEVRLQLKAAVVAEAPAENGRVVLLTQAHTSAQASLGRRAWEGWRTQR